MRQLASLILLIVVLAACGAPVDSPTSSPTLPTTSTPVPEQATSSQPTVSVKVPTAPPAHTALPAPPTAPPVQPTPTTPPSDTSSPAASRVLAWNSNAAVLAWYATNGKPDELGGASPRALAIPCVQAGDWLALHLGGESNGVQEIYSLANSKPLALGNSNGLACALSGGFQFSPDGKRLGLLNYASNAITKKFTVGTLRILGIPGGTEQFNINDVTGYHLNDDGVAMLQFYANDRGEASVADLRWWDGAALRPLEQDIRPLQDCYFVSGRALRHHDRVYTLLGERCTGRGSTWRLLRTDLKGGASVNLSSGSSGGAYFPNAATNALWAIPGRDELLITYPNGLSSDVANLARISLADGKIIPVIDTVVVDFHPPSLPRRMLFSPDGMRLAMVRRGGNGIEQLLVYRLDAPDTKPEAVAGGGRSDRILAVAWGSDSQRLFYITTGETSAIYYLTLAEPVTRTLVMRGIFQGLVLSADASALATSEQVQVATNDVRNNLLLITVADQRSAILVEGSRGESALVPLAVR